MAYQITDERVFVQQLVRAGSKKVKAFVAFFSEESIVKRWIALTKGQ